MHYQTNLLARLPYTISSCVWENAIGNSLVINQMRCPFMFTRLARERLIEEYRCETLVRGSARRQVSTKTEHEARVLANGYRTSAELEPYQHVHAPRKVGSGTIP